MHALGVVREPGSGLDTAGAQYTRGGNFYLSHMTESMALCSFGVLLLSPATQMSLTGLLEGDSERSVRFKDFCFRAPNTLFWDLHPDSALGTISYNYNV